MKKLSLEDESSFVGREYLPSFSPLKHYAELSC